MQGFARASIFLAVISAWNALAQNTPAKPQWFIQPKAFAVYHAPSMNLDASPGIALTLGRRLKHGWSVAWESAYHQARQPLNLFGDRKELKSDWIRVALALQKFWWLEAKQRCAVFAETEAGLLYWRTRTLTIPGGTLETITLRAQHENKFVPALGAGGCVRVCPRWAVLFYGKNHFMRWEERRLEHATSKRVWKSYWQLAAGMSYFF